jgi:hypothetical protein
MCNFCHYDHSEMKFLEMKAFSARRQKSSQSNSRGNSQCNSQEAGSMEASELADRLSQIESLDQLHGTRMSL